MQSISEVKLTNLQGRARLEESAVNLQQSGSGVIVYGTNFEVGPNYEIVSPIGQGAYGVVVAAKVQNLNEADEMGDGGQGSDDDGNGGGKGSEMVAIKKIMLQSANAGMVRRTLRELKILRLVQHENCLTLLSVLPPPSREEFKELYLVTNLMPTNLQQEIRKSRIGQSELPPQQAPSALEQSQNRAGAGENMVGLTEKHHEYFLY